MYIFFGDRLAHLQQIGVNNLRLDKTDCLHAQRTGYGLLLGAGGRSNLLP
jgi:hypothetical protein